MFTLEEARTKVASKVCRPMDGMASDDEIVILDDKTIHRDWGWIFFYDSKRWQETQDIRYAIAGNAPIIVEKTTGRLLVTGTAHGLEYYIKNYERTGNPKG